MDTTNTSTIRTRNHSSTRQNRPIKYRGYTIVRTDDGFECDGVEEVELSELRKLIDAWVAETAHEARCESMEAARFEEMAHGWD
jgi:hypothetical protein